jgi:hypothetical protein
MLGLEGVYSTPKLQSNPCRQPRALRGRRPVRAEHRQSLSMLPQRGRSDPDLAAWPAPGFEDTELGVLTELEVSHGEMEVYAGVQA